MGLGNGNAKSGNKGSNFNYEHRSLQLLGAISSSFGGGATEATLLLVLSTLQNLFNEQKIDFELKCVVDSNGDTFQLRVLADEPSGSYTIDYIDATGAVASPVGAITFCNPDTLLNSILSELITLNTTDFATAANQALAIAELQSIVSNTSNVATETTLAAFLSAFSATDFATENTLSALSLVDFATETTLSAQAANILALLNAFNAEDFATETTLTTLLTAFSATDFATETTLSSLAAEDFATEATLAAIQTLILTANTTLANIKTDTANLDVNLSTRASEATLAKMVGLAITEYDEIDLTYIVAGNGTGEIGTVVYSLATVPVATLTLTYDASNRLTNVTKS